MGAGLFVHPQPYIAWELWYHVLSGLAAALSATAVLAWALTVAWERWRRLLLPLARWAVGVAVASVAGALWVAGSPPALALSTPALGQAMAQALAQDAGAPPDQVSAPAWAQGAAQALLKHYSDYLQGRYLPKPPPGYRMAVLLAPTQYVVQPLLTRGNTAPLPAIAKQVVSVLMTQMPESTLEQVSQAYRTAVGVAQGTAVTSTRHIPMVLIAVFVRFHG